MARTPHYAIRLPENLRTQLEALSRDTGAPMAWHIKRAVEAYLEAESQVPPQVAPLAAPSKAPPVAPVVPPTVSAGRAPGAGKQTAPKPATVVDQALDFERAHGRKPTYSELKALGK